MKDQSKITDSSLVSWKNDFNEREYQYLKNIINGLISKVIIRPSHLFHT